MHGKPDFNSFTETTPFDNCKNYLRAIYLKA